MVRTGQAIGTASVVDLEGEGDVRHLSDFAIADDVLLSMGAQVRKHLEDRPTDAHGNPTAFNKVDPRSGLTGRGVKWWLAMTPSS